ncbi:MAG: protease modulator HflC [Gammaproteobacteria bacterium]|mgnify:CR=1 FL=1|nr:MAG: protease modulator HflC [Gammaproteobacteria bacterium]
MRLFVISIICLLVVGITLSSTYSIDEREWGIVTQFGKSVRTVDEPGLHFKMPGFINKVNRFDKRIQQLDTQPIQLLLGDKNPIITSCFIAWKINDPVIFFQSLQNLDNAKQKISDMINSQLGIVFSDYSIQQIINTDPSKVKIEDIENKLIRSSNQSASSKYGVSIEHIGIIRLSYPAVVMKSVYERMKAEREMEAEKIRAEGREDAGKIIVEAKKQAQEIKAIAEKKALILRGEADKEALKIYADAYSQNPEYFEFIRSMETYETLFDNNSVLLLSTESDLMKYLVNDINRNNSSESK